MINIKFLVIATAVLMGTFGFIPQSYAGAGQADLELTHITTTPFLPHPSTFTTDIRLITIVTNLGLADATNIVVFNFHFPYEGDAQCDASGSSSYNFLTGLWTIPSLPVGTSATLDCIGETTSLGTFPNTAEIISVDNPDPDSTPNNNVESEDDQDSVSVTIVADTDNDFIADNVDTQPNTPSSSFSDGNSFGDVTGGPGRVYVSDDPTNGVIIVATGISSVSACGGGTDLTLTGQDSISLTCGSATIEVLSGPVEVEFSAGGTTTTTVLNTGQSLTVDDENGTITNNGTDPVIVIVNGVQKTILPGETLQLSDIQIGGHILPIDNTSLILAGFQSSTAWMIPTIVVGLAGAGIYMIKFRTTKE